MDNHAFALYDAFTDSVFGGSQAAVVSDAAGIPLARRHALAREIGMPATAFVDACGNDWVQVQFISTVMELPMCGHGTVCLMTQLLESGRIELQAPREFQLRLPAGSARVALERRGDGRCRVMLEVRVPDFEAAPPHTGELLGLLGLEQQALDDNLPLETARGDFVHLVVPLAGLDAMRAIEPDFDGLAAFCRRHGQETVAVFCREVEDPRNTLHVRDFCPAVGVSESAAAGTTNAALTSYLLRHRLLPGDGDQVTVHAEQGIEMGRPSSIESRITLADGEIVRLRVGGTATKLLDGQVFL